MRIKKDENENSTRIEETQALQALQWNARWARWVLQGMPQGTGHDWGKCEMNRAAQQLGRMAKGKRKTLSKAERKRRAERLAVARQKRWPSTQNAQADRPAKAGERGES